MNHHGNNTTNSSSSVGPRAADWAHADGVQSTVVTYCCQQTLLADSSGSKPVLQPIGQQSAKTGSSANRVGRLKADTHNRLRAEATAATVKPVRGNRGSGALIRSLLNPRKSRDANAALMQIIALSE